MRIGLIGYGRIAPRHVEVFRSLDADVVAAVNRRAESRRHAQVVGGIRATYATVAEMVARESPDALICCVPFHEMFAVASATIPLGIPMLIEKPPGTSVSEVSALAALADRHGTPTMVAVNRRHYSVIRAALADCGGVDRIRQVSVQWSENPGAFRARGFTEAQVQRLVYANSLHGLDLLTWLAGEVVTLHAVGTKAPVSVSMGLQGESSRGVHVSFVSTWDAPVPWQLAFSVPDACYVFAPLETCRVFRSGAQGAVAIEPHEDDRRFKPGFLGQARVFLDVARRRLMQHEHNLASTLPAMRLAEALTDACPQLTQGWAAHG